MNFLVDGIVCLVLYYPVGYLVSAVLWRFGAELFAVVDAPLQAWPPAVGLLLFIATTYYTVMEAATNGRSVGKWLTGMIAVRLGDQTFTTRDAWIRSLCRIIPLEPVSALAGQPWHDRFSKTRVIRRVKPTMPQETQLPDSSSIYDVQP